MNVTKFGAINQHQQLEFSTHTQKKSHINAEDDILNVWQFFFASSV